MALQSSRVERQPEKIITSTAYAPFSEWLTGKALPQHACDGLTSLQTDDQGRDDFYWHVNQKFLHALYLQHHSKDTNVTERNTADISKEKLQSFQKIWKHEMLSILNFSVL